MCMHIIVMISNVANCSVQYIDRNSSKINHFQAKNAHVINQTKNEGLVGMTHACRQMYMAS